MINCSFNSFSLTECLQSCIMVSNVLLLKSGTAEISLSVDPSPPGPSAAQEAQTPADEHLRINARIALCRFRHLVIWLLTGRLPFVSSTLRTVSAKLKRWSISKTTADCSSDPSAMSTKANNSDLWHISSTVASAISQSVHCDKSCWTRLSLFRFLFPGTAMYLVESGAVLMSNIYPSPLTSTPSPRCKSSPWKHVTFRIVHCTDRATNHC